MHVNPYGGDAVRLAVRLAWAAPLGTAELARTCADEGLRLPRRPTRADLVEVETALDRWMEVVDARSEGQRARLLNEMLAAYTTQPRLTDHAGDGWHLHYRPESVTVGQLVAALIAIGTSLHLVSRGMHRLARCAAADCTRPFADLSRNGTQQYCSPACANRSAVRRHRERRVRRR